MDRRHFLQVATLLGGAFATRALADLSGPAVSDSEALQPLATGPSIGELPANLFQIQERTDLAAMVEAVIPRTDTPGAVDAGVPNFVEHMVQHWLSDAERALFLKGFRALQVASREKHSREFSQLTMDQQLDFLEALEDEASGSPWYDFANVQRQYVEGAPFICQLKELTIFGFYSSEVGATQVLRHDPMPMQFDGEFVLNEDDSTWSMIRLM
ncbi:gluconate 2-dehydrogenase subunit 3 family protein [Pseudoteredinibacter isoporae]|uniref:Gluconate 2-dehydrogenase subunit 3 family protein n=1 Tax=Pseudoteredinibacter isoporae TaxID=570281 RepID=A0A7X0MU87_9GAMM|nr:gluconate 2-dehydrogenase subunit 3 family protein [Pseudoteredinibacter isoporae]MBB6520366.1 hypothetical protein [Pseudoteredinibacter isoporae]NHO85936.1 gluconate 2-dehydrogenase subunit 3 family protein [Pseudoteredinibacter isoporae]NIB25612.1 gluconate 2-dehydrogenase subunit 3 family protein [Pseudoteredinibacter isoporae]